MLHGRRPAAGLARDRPGPGDCDPQPDRGPAFVNGGSAVTPRPHLTGTSVASAGQAAYAQLLHEVLGEEGIQVSQLIIPGAIIAGDPVKDPEILPRHLWDLHTQRDRFRYTVGD